MKRNKERLFWIALVLAQLVLFGYFLYIQREPGSVGDTFNYIENNYIGDYSPQELYDAAMKGMAESLNDPYSVYYSKKEMSLLLDTTRGDFIGVGLYITDPTEKDIDSGKPFVRVVEPIKGSPAYSAGVKADDRIFAVNEKSVEGLNAEEMKDLLRGERGTSVFITFLRADSYKFNVTIMREIVELPTVEADMIDNKTAYISIKRFTPHTTDNFKETYLSLVEDNDFVNLIIDLRGNPGGTLDSVLTLTDLFLDKAEIVSMRSNRKKKSFHSKGGVFVPEDISIALLIDQGSASASEIFTGALKDHGRALVFGENSYGKALVQAIKPLEKGYLKLTIAHYYTPAGENIAGVGIAPDIPVPTPALSEEDLKGLQIIFEKDIIRNFVINNTDFTDSELEDFYQDILSQGIKVNPWFFKRYVREERTRIVDPSPIFDIEYDPVLSEAYNHIRKTNNGSDTSENNIQGSND